MATLTGTHAQSDAALQQPREAAPEAAFPFAVEILTALGAATVARLSSPGTAWAAYYAAIQAFPEAFVSLQHGGRRLAHSRP